MVLLATQETIQVEVLCKTYLAVQIVLLLGCDLSMDRCVEFGTRVVNSPNHLLRGVHIMFC